MGMADLKRNFRKSKFEKDTAHKTIQSIMKRVTGNITPILRKRTGSKMLQSVFKYANDDTKEQIFEEIKGEIPNLISCSFSVFFLQKLLATKYFNQIVEILGKYHKKIITDRVGAFLLDEAYQKLKRGPQKDFIKHLLGDKVRVFYANKKLMEIPAKELEFGNITRKMMDKGLTNLTIAHDLIHLHIDHFESQEDRQLYVRGLVEFFVDF